MKRRGKKKEREKMGEILERQSERATEMMRQRDGIRERHRERYTWQRE